MPVLRTALLHGVGAAFVAVFAYVTASHFSFMHEAYWAAIAAAVSLFPERNATVQAGVQQLLGAAIGGVIGWASASWWHGDVLIYGAAVLLAVSVCYLFRCQAAARLSAVAVTIITVIPTAASPATRALDRFVEVSYGVACAIGFTAAIAAVTALWLRRPPMHRADAGSGHPTR